MPTIAEREQLLRLAKARKLKRSASDQAPLEPADRSAPLALSFAQRRLWFLEQLGGAGTAYHIPTGLRLRGELDRDALVRALDRIVARHEVLRTTFVQADGEPEQRIAPESRFPLLDHDPAGHPQPEAELRRVMREEAAAPFDLARGPLIRGRLVRLAADDHVLLVTMHHIVSDGWSMGVLTRELSALYAAFTRGDPDPLPPLPVQYADYAAWQRRWVEGEVLQRQAEYWRTTLAGAPELLQLPADRPRPARQDHAGAAIRIELGEELTAGLKALGERHETTLFMTLLAGWSAVLGRLSGQDDVVIGTPAANRGRAEIEGLIGLFVNTLALRVDLSGAPSVAELLARVKETALAAQQHPDIPFEQVVEVVHPARSLAHTPLFQVMFAWQNAPAGELELPGLRLSPARPSEQVTAKLDLTLSLAEVDGRIAGAVEYATALFDRETVERWTGYLRRALEAMAADDGAAVERLPLLGGDERRRVLETWNATDAAYPAGACIHELFEAQAGRTPGAAAVVFAGESLSYAALNARANRLAHHLRGLGVGPEVRVAICVERGPEMMVTLLAVLKAGGAYLPLDPDHPAGRLRQVLDDAAPALLLTQAPLAGRFAGVEIPRVWVDQDAGAWAHRPETNPRVPGLGPDSLAYVIYTSGSTGRPKGVMNLHGGAANLLWSMRSTLGMAPADRLLAVTTLSFDIAALELFLPLLCGARVEILPRTAGADPALLQAAIAGGAGTVLQATPTSWRLLVDHGWRGAGGLRALCGGEALPGDLAARVRERVAGLWNVYGPTETTIWSSSHPVGTAGEGRGPVAIGRPVANTRIYVLDRAGEPVPVGAAGEVHIGGAGVARGYLGRAALTAERFVPDPFGGRAGARMYRTGDVGRWRRDGTLEYVGRDDVQVKVRGYRIEPGEIEARLAELPGVCEAVVVAREDAPGDRRLVAYVVGDEVDAGALRAGLLERLPEYMVPAAYVRLAALPLTPNGKVSRGALPAPGAGVYATRAYQAPAGETEAALSAIWAELLKVERVGRRDHFFDLGGHSLLAVQVVSRVRQALGVEMALGDLFVHPVLEDLARALAGAGRAELSAIEPVERGGPLPLSFAQQRLWFLEQLGSGGAAYHVPARLRLRGALDRDALGRALDRIVARHEALRTTFAAVDGRPGQRIAPAAESRFHLLDHDLAGHPAADAELRRQVAEEAGAPFDLERGPLVRGRLLRVGHDEHVLLVTMHHIVSDGWSIPVLVREVSALYGAFVRGEADPLPPLPLQYADYASWQRSRADAPAQLDYWSRTLAGAPELLELPTDHPRPARRGHAGGSVAVHLDPALTAGVKALGRREGTTPFMTVLAGWAVVLGRLAGQDDVVIGTPTANRGRRETEGLIGFFVNTLALRVDLSGGPTVAELLARVKARALDAQHNQDVPFEQVVEAVRPGRSLAHTPLFQVLFAWQNTPRERLDLPGLEVAAVPAPAEGTAKFDLSLSLHEAGGCITGGLTYATALLEPATAGRYAGYLRRVLEAMVAGPEARAGDLALMPEPERRQVLRAWNATAAEYPDDACIHELFEAQARRTPAAVAVVHEGGRLTYAELNAGANRLAHHLRARGVAPDVRVAMCLERSPEMLVGVLAVLKAGGAYVPLEPEHPAERLRHVLDDSAPALLLTHSPLAGRFAGMDIPRVSVDGDSHAWAQRPETNPRVPGLGPDSLAYVIYTSGSTGRPKGVMNPHRGLVNRLTAGQRAWRLEPGEAVLQKTSLGFDGSVREIFWPLMVGARVVLARPGGHRDPAYLLETIREDGVTTVNLVPSMLQVLVEAPGLAGCTGLRRVLCGGEALPAALLAQFGARLPRVALHNLYGPSEAATAVVAVRCTAAEARATVPIGRPNANTRAYVLDASGMPVPPGVAGELYIGGAGVARGYQGRPALTAERFVPDRFGAEPGGRLYRTGDLARWLPDGQLEFLGRNDFQVKVRGFRVEPGEVEARLLEHGAVREAVVVAREDASGDRRLVAYCAGDGIDAESLRAHLSGRLPEYMVPAAYVRLDALPLTPNGKVDRKALPEPGSDAHAARAYQAPATGTEAALAEIWAGVLGVERVGRHDHFFELGGHSLLAVRVVSRVRQVLGAEVPLGDLFLHPVLADFARVVEHATRAELPAIEPAERGGELALSFAQQRLWFLDRLGGAGKAYHVLKRLRLRGELDRDALGRALDRIVARHESLRTTFVEHDGEPAQRVAPAAESRFPLLDHDLAGDPGAEAELGRVLAEEAAAPFDLERGPLIRGRLVRLAADDHVLAVTMHHIVSDAWSVGVMTRELGALYAAFTRGDPSALPPLPVQYADYAAWQRRWVEGDVLQRQADYWRTTLAGAPELLELPADRPRPARQDHAGAAVRLELDEALTAGLKELGRREGTTLFMTLLAGWALVLGRLSGEDDVVVGTPAANRGRAEIEGLIGFFVNTLALRVDLSGSPTVAELLARVKKTALAAQQHQEIPFEQVVEAVRPARSMAHAPLFQVVFAWQNAPGERLELPGLTLDAAGPASTTTARFDLALTLQEVGGRIVGGVEYATALFDGATVERWLGYLRRALEEMTRDERRRVGHLRLLAGAERRQVLEAWNATAAEYPGDACVHELVEAQARRTPGAPAVVHDGGRLTYAELNARANRLAHYLRERGVGPDVRAGMCVERGPEMVIGLLAVLKAGGAYVPLDPAYPADRLRYMLADSAPAVLLTHSALAGRFAGCGVPVVELDAAAPEWAGHAVTDPPRGQVGVTPDHLAYVIYTSGSTGRPKGVMARHRGVCNLALAQIRDFRVEPESRVLQFASFSFDACVSEVFTALCRGASLCLPPAGVPLAGRVLADAVAALEITHLTLPPAVLASLPDAAALEPARVLVLAGDAVTGAVARRWADGRRLLNAYGPTEATVCATVGVCRTGDAGSPAIGRPIANARVYLLGGEGEPVPPGVAGELYVGGAGVARGYLGRPALTAERFGPDPFGAEPGGRLYRTGDLARWLGDGRLEFLGRRDFQVKVRGFRVEPGEVEARLLEHAAVREAVVVVRRDAPGEPRLVAYCAGDGIDAESLRAHLSGRLPEYMVPAAYVRLDALPLTPNGKVDRAALPAPEGDVYAARAYEAPATGAEAALAEIWAGVLGMERVGRHDHFFELGGHSLLAVRVVSRVRQVLGAEVALGDLFVHPVLADLAQVVERAARAELPAIEPAERGGDLALSFAQQRLWFLDRLGGAGRAYHLLKGLPLRGELDREALGRALDRIVARHESLRTTFAEVDGEPVQRIARAEESPFQLAEHDLRGDPGAGAELRRLVAGEADAPFDLARGPLIRGRLVRVADDDHLLLITMHHIVSDGWSMEVLTRELGALYAAFRNGEPDPLPALPIQYADYAVWQRKWVGGEVLKAQAEYWKTALAGAPELLELPADHVRPARQDFSGGVAGIELDVELTAGLKALSRRHGATLFMTLLAGWAAVLSRLAGQDDVVVGTPTANRGRSEIEGLIGFFVNTLAVRLELSDAPSVAGALARVKERSLGAQHHQDIPFEQVVELLQPVRSLSHTPLFQVMFAWQNAAERELELPGVASASGGAAPGPAPWQGPAARATAKFDLSLTLSEGDGRIVGAAVYAAALFERATVERWLGYLRRALEAMVADESQSVARLPLLGEAERRRVVEEWNATATAAPAEPFVHARFEAQARRTPGAAALVFEGETLSYGELNARANRLAHHLRALGVGPDARVAICVEGGPAMVVGALAVLKAGGAYLPLDPAYPGERLRYTLEDGAPVAVLAGSALLGLFEGVHVPVLDLEAPRPAWADRPESDPERGALSPAHLAYVIYTSGSTGRPKGVRVSHASLGATLSVAGDAFGFGAGDRVPSLASFAFDIWLFETLLPLLAGGAVLMVPRERVPDVPRLVDDLAACTHLHAVPALMRRTVEEVRARPGGALPALRRVFVGGDAVAPDLLEEMRGAFPAAEISVLYGPTEATIICAAHRLGSEPAARQMVGRPLGNAALYVLDAAGQVAPTGAAGELCLGGASVARDYLGRPGLTAERFVPDPFASRPGARLYRTGDRVRWLASGELEFLGRTDRQVKVRGYRIEPGEIEARLAEHPAVRAPVVLAREDMPGDRRLVAYYLADEPVAVDALKTHLAGRLPGYMVPAAYVWMERLPLTPNGKVDRAALPAPEGDAYAAGEYEAPVGETEAALADVWAQVLGVERVGRGDDFFELGGHSLLAVRVISRVRQLLGVDAALGDVFTRPVLADFARGLAAAARSDLPAIEPVERGSDLPLSFAQRRLWFLEQLGSGGTAYHIPAGLRLRGELDRGALVRALDRIVVRHEALRTTFVQAGGEPAQRIAPASESRFPLLDHDLAGHPEAEAELRRVMAEEASTPFDLVHGPLIRGRLVRLAEDDHVLAVTMHHIVSDGWSMGVLTDELSALYAAFSRGDPDPLPPLPVQYADYAAWQRRWVEGDVLQRQAEYWRATLAGAPELLELPADHPRPARQDHAGATLRLELDEALTAGLKALGRRHGTTLFMTLLAGWAAVLSRLSGQDDVVVGTPAANRGRAEIEGLIGFFVNTLALRLDLSAAPSVAELLARVKETALAAQQHQDLPFEQVVELVQPARSLAHTPLFQVMFAWQSAPGGELELPGLRLAPAPASGRVTAKFDLSLSLAEAGGRIAGGLEYATALYGRETAGRYLGYLRRVLEAMVADDGAAMELLPLLDAEERRRVVEEWNATDAAFPGDRSVHELFERQVERTPAAVAVVHGDRSLTYAELNARANRLAHALREAGVAPGARVTVLVPRSIDLVVAELAVLKAGAAYVPVDPSFPAERVAYMATDSGSRFVLAVAGAALPELPAVRRIDVDAAGEGRTDDPRVPVPGGAAAYVMYTSGSTGAPKGVVVPHRAIARVAINNGYAEFGADARVAFAANPAFDATTMEVWGPLLNGGRTVVVAQDVLLDPPAFARLVEEQGVTALFVTTAVFNQYAATIPDALAGLRHLLTGGERADPAAFARVLREGGPGSLIHCYGPTETTTFAITHRVDRVTDDARTVPLGRPISNTRIYVLDGAGNPVPAGVVGEMYIGGAGVAHGYLGRPGLTAERFVPDPFAGGPGARLYRTGDLGRWLADGTIEFVGRNDFQVKVRGHRIEPGEVEARLLEHPSVREGLVLAREDAPGDRRLVAYFVATDEALDAQALRSHLAASLPEYMVPAAYVRMDALPLNPNGKVERRALPAPDGDAYAARGYEAPVGRAEDALARIWAELLGLERVGRWDHFFELGGHSLRVVQVVSRVREEMGVEVALGELFAHPVLADYARALGAASRVELPPILPAGRQGPIPLSFAQQRLWIVDHLQGAGRAYHVATGLRLRGALDGDALRRALDRIVARHEALRTTFAELPDGTPEQKVAPAEESRFHLSGHDLGGDPDAEPGLRRLMAEEAGAPFDLRRGPLIRGRLVRMAEDDHVLLVTMHHIVSDGWSIGVLTRELGALYGAFRRGEADPLPPLPVQYPDYAAWQRGRVDGEALRRQAEYWEGALAGAPEVLALPADRARPARQDFTGAFVGVALDEELTAGLTALSRRHGTTPFMTLLAGWAVVLGRLAGHDDVVIGTPTANRGQREIEGLIGFFVNTLALRVDLSGGPTVAELLRRVKARALEAQQNQDIPFEQVVERVRPARSLAHSPVFQVMFAWQNAPVERLELPGLTLGPVAQAPQVAAAFDLSLALSEANGRIVGGVEYAAALFEEETVERYLGYLRRVLEAMAADDRQAVDRLPLMHADERRRLLADADDDVEISL